MSYGTGYSNYERVPDPPTRRFIVGLDLGQSQDPTAIVTTERVAGAGDARYDVPNIQRIRLGTSYPAIVRHVGRMIETFLAMRPRVDIQLIVDGTGVGRPVVDLFTEADFGCSVIPVSIHGGNVVGRDGIWLSVPKRDLVGTIRVLLETQRLRIAEADPLAAALTGELTNFRVTISKGGHDSYGAGPGIGGDDWRDGGKHDDLVLALALATWYGETHSGGGWVPLSPDIAAWFRQAGIAT